MPRSTESRSVDGTRLLFAYGTLRREGPMHGLLAGRARYLGAAAFRGQLWDLGAYPAATESRSRSHHVRGELYELPEEGWLRLLDTLDRYEGEVFERALRQVVGEDGSRHTAYLYLFLGSTRRARRIPSGDYVADVRRAGQAARHE